MTFPALDVSIAAACLRIRYDKEENLRRIVSLVEKAANSSANLVLFPELSLQGSCWDTDFYGEPEQRKYYYENAEPIPGPATDLLSKYARTHRIYIQLGMAERPPDSANEIPYNTVCLIGPDGVAGIFRKIHSKSEWPLFNQGNSISVWKTPIGWLAPVICSDLNFPEVTRIQALQGAEIITMSAAWWMLNSGDPEVDYGARSYENISKASAMINQIWLVQSNAVGVPDGNRSKSNYYGHSRIISPLGEIVAETSVDEGLAIARFNVKETIRNATMDGMNFLKDRRPELYGVLNDPTIYEKIRGNS